MKKKILIKTFKDTLFVVLATFIGWFVLTWIHGPTLGATPNKCESTPFKDAVQEIPGILFIAIGGGFFYFPIGYGYSKDRLEKQRKSEEETDKK